MHVSRAHVIFVRERLERAEGNDQRVGGVLRAVARVRAGSTSTVSDGIALGPRRNLTNVHDRSRGTNRVTPTLTFVG